MNRAFVYTRVSPLAGIDHPRLIEKLTHLKEYAKSHDMQIVEEFHEIDSGRDMQREGVMKIRNRIWDKDIDCLLMTDEAELSDDPLLLELIRAEAEDSGVSVIIAAL